jgi:hypothetical protein
MKGGCCEKCGYNKNMAAFDFHHKNPKEKDYNLDVRKLTNSTMAKLMIEVEKCELLCANCHRETHYPDLDFEKVYEKLNDTYDSALEIRTMGKPKCLDCGCEINYTHKRCKPCEDKNRRKVEHPNIETLLQELETHTQQWCADKYGVSRTTIMRWVKTNK